MVLTFTTGSITPSNIGVVWGQTDKDLAANTMSHCLTHRVGDENNDEPGSGDGYKIRSEYFAYDPNGVRDMYGTVSFNSGEMVYQTFRAAAVDADWITMDNDSDGRRLNGSNEKEFDEVVAPVKNHDIHFKFYHDTSGTFSEKVLAYRQILENWTEDGNLDLVICPAYTSAKHTVSVAGTWTPYGENESASAFDLLLMGGDNLRVIQRETTQEFTKVLVE